MFYFEYITHQLAGKKQDSFQRESKIALRKEVVEVRAEALNHQYIETSFHTKPVCARDTDAIPKLRVDSKFMVQCMILPFHWLEFDDNPFLWQNVVRKVYYICLLKSNMWCK